MAISKPVYEDDDSVDEQIRSAAAARSADKTAPDMSADEEPAAPAAKMLSKPGQASSGSKTPMVTKEQLAASGLSLRDYLNKQQGLTRRGDSAPTSARMPELPGQEAPISSNEGRNKPSPSKTSMGSDNDYAMNVNERIKKSLASTREGSGPTDYRSVNQRIKEALGMKKGGTVKKMASGGSVSSASKRADGIAQRGKTRGTMC